MNLYAVLGVPAVLFTTLLAKERAVTDREPNQEQCLLSHALLTMENGTLNTSTLWQERGNVVVYRVSGNAKRIRTSRDGAGRLVEHSNTAPGTNIATYTDHRRITPLCPPTMPSTSPNNDEEA